MFTMACRIWNWFWMSIDVKAGKPEPILRWGICMLTTQRLGFALEPPCVAR